MQYSISDFLNLAFGIILFFLGIKIRKTYQRREEQYEVKATKAVQDFAMSCIGMGFFQIMIGIPPLFLLLTTLNIDIYLQLYRVGFYIGIMPLMMSTAFLMALPSDFYFPKLRRLILTLGLIASVTIMLALLITPANPIRVEGITRINASGFTNAIIGIFGSIATAVGSITFAYTALSNSLRKISKLRSWFLAIGYIVIAVAGPAHLFVKTSMQYVIFDALQVGGVILIGIAIVALKPGKYV